MTDFFFSVVGAQQADSLTNDLCYCYDNPRHWLHRALTECLSTTFSLLIWLPS